LRKEDAGPHAAYGLAGGFAGCCISSRSRCLRLRASSRAVSRRSVLVLNGGVSPVCCFPVARSWGLAVERGVSAFTSECPLA